MSSIRPSIPKGTRDFSPEVMAKREFIFNTLKSTFRKFGFQQLETPSMENLEVLTGKYGEEGDRLIFKILNSGDYLSEIGGEQDLIQATKKGSAAFTPRIAEKALRYDLTVPFARYVVMNQGEINFPFKRFQVQPVWRADRPQRGRYREFYQCDADVVGSDSLLYEAELIALYAQAFSALGMGKVRIEVNNRKILNALAARAGQPEKVKELCIAIDKLDKIGKEGVLKELEARGFSPAETQSVFDFLAFEGSNAEKISFLRAQVAGIESGEKGAEEMERVFQYLENLDVKEAEVVLEFNLARGLDYYTGTIFEVKPLGVKMGSLGGGGRYADLTGIFGLPGISGVGISFGADRIYDVMEEMGLFGSMESISSKVLVLYFSDETLAACLNLLQQLRDAGIASEMYPEPVKFGKQFKYAEKKNIPYALILGPEEAAKNIVILKDLVRGGQTEYSISQAIEKLI